MSHLDEGLITALLDGELSPAETRDARDHLAICGECNARFEEARGWFDEANRLVRVLDVPVATPPVPLALHPAPAPRRRGVQVRHLAWAASLLLAIGLGYYVNQAGAPRQIALDSTQQTRAASTAVANEAARQVAAEPAAPAAAGGRADAQAKTAPAKDAPATAFRTQAPRPPAEVDEHSLDKEKPAGANQPAASGEVASTALARQPAAPAAAPAVDSLTALKSEARREDAQPLQAARAADLRDAGASGVLERKRGLAANALAASPPPVAVTLEEAVASLGGSIHLIDGLTPERVERLDGRQMAGAAAELTLVRVIYLDSPMRELWLDQQRGMPAATGDTVLLHNSDGSLSLQWASPPDGWLSLTGHLTADSLRSLARRVR